MINSLKNILANVTLAARNSFGKKQQDPQETMFADESYTLGESRSFMPSRRTMIATAVVLSMAAGAYFIVKHPPVQTINAGQAGLRMNQLTGAVSEMGEGNAWVIPGLHSLRVLPLRDQSYRAESMAKANGSAPVQSVEGLSLGIDLMVRYAVDPSKVSNVAARTQQDMGSELVDPAVQGVAYKTFARYTVREIFSSKRVEIQQAIEAELKTRLAQEGLILRSVQVGKVDLPADYSRRMETLLAEELATEKMRYTLVLKEKQVKETELEAQAEKVRSETQAQAAGNVQIIAAKAQEEAMKHVLPFKQRQIEQRKLEAEAEKQSRIRTAEGSAEARRIEADGEAKARQRLAEAEAFRVQKVGMAGAEQMAREGALLTRHPLLIQKAMADKLSDKVQVIIAPTPSDGSFIGAALLGTQKTAAPEQSAQAPAEQESKDQ
ncbi:MAG: prohibitin family protein [Burkholderiales bacterium]|nr:MAG: prohibitin family protein [Burkholderiales bacterium]